MNFELRLLHGYNLYHTEYILNNFDHDCLSYFPSPVQFSYQFIQYCIRYPIDKLEFDYVNYYNHSFTFEDLYERNVTSQQLYEWSAPIDLIENYQEYLETNQSNKKYFFYNCTHPRFGSHCEYYFDLNLDYVSRIIESTYKESIFLDVDKVTTSCYIHIHWNCFGNENRTATDCLDWREICNGKIECINGRYDEEFCWQLEFNECDNQTEFRCYNGLCIPLDFLHDDRYNPDCLDRSDEPLFQFSDQTKCYSDPTFRCEEHRCDPTRYKNDIIECGDGSCIERYAVCYNGRTEKIFNSYWLQMNTSDKCQLAVQCFIDLSTKEIYAELCFYKTTLKHIIDIHRYCPQTIRIPAFLFGHVQIALTTVLKINNTIDLQVYICYNDKICSGLLFSNDFELPIDLFHDNTTCRLMKIPSLYSSTSFSWTDIIKYLYRLFYKCSNYPELSHHHISNNSNFYQCINSSKVISKHRLLDGIEDCPHNDDESYAESCSLQNLNHRFKCDQHLKRKCITYWCVLNQYDDCLDRSDEHENFIQNQRTNISFPIMCDGFTELPPIMINGHNYTDETECSYSSCNNIYTRCDYIWNCIDGADEVNCEWPSMCPSSHHMCILSTSQQLSCLHINQTNDGIIDCLGAFDERQYCRDMHKSGHNVRYRCSNSSKCIGNSLVCHKENSHCIGNNLDVYKPYCSQYNSPYLTMRCKERENFIHLEQILCTFTDIMKNSLVHFTLEGYTSYKSLKTDTNNELSMNSNRILSTKDNHDIKSWPCNRGLMIYQILDENNNTRTVCFCPPAYYGDSCQYQNQRVSLTLQIKSSFDFRTMFTVIITLRDDEQNQIQSHEQFNYLYERDCSKKYNIYLLYVNRPKNLSTNYSVHIDIFDKEAMQYRASWLYPVKFAFLPVYHLAIQIEIHAIVKVTQNCATLNCGNHGRCSQYVNIQKLFCVCHQGWTGKNCHISYKNLCSSKSISFGPNICICPMGKFGSRCFLTHSSCSCENNGTCVSDDERTNERQINWCICPKGYSGPTCTQRDTTLTVSFAPEILVPSNVLMHFIQVFDRHNPQPHIRSSIPKMIPPDQEVLAMNWSRPFHLVYMEIIPSKILYLTVLQFIHTPSANLSSTLKLSDRCMNLSELLNETIVNWHPIRRMKYYHIPCQQRTDLRCFYDERHICICNQTLRQANCMPFDHSISYECESSNLCENNGKCFRDRPNCPNSFMCVCEDCSYGARCQISTKVFGLSLDVILGYQFRPNRSFKQQSLTIHFATIMITSMLLFGLINGLLSISTFHKKKTHEAGCGYYLLASSYISTATIIIFALKFYFLLVSQMNLLTNRRYLKFNCIVFEYFLKSLLSIGDWLNACVSIERAYIAFKYTRFNAKFAKYISKRMTISICLFVFLTHIHDPIFRDLIDDIETNRVWCHVQFNQYVQMYNTILLSFHFIAPFVLNICSALITLTFTSRHKARAHKKDNYGQHLRKQFYVLKHLFISPLILILLALPRLIISFLSGCMKTARDDPWLYLIGYLISFVPPMSLIFVFILPSDVYKTEFKNTFRRSKNTTVSTGRS